MEYVILPGMMRVMMAVTANICLANKTAILSLAALDLLHHALPLHPALWRHPSRHQHLLRHCWHVFPLTTHTCSPETRGSQDYSVLIT